MPKKTKESVQKPLSHNNLQRVNEELYKRNLEIVIRNRVLSLLHELYDISANTLEMKKLGEKFVYSISHILELPFVGIFFVDQDKHFLSPLAASSDVLEDDISVFINAPSPLGVSLSAKNHVCVHALQKGKRIQSRSFYADFGAYLSSAATKILKDHVSIRTTLVYPLLMNDKKLGILTIALDRSYGKLTLFEKESIENLVNVVTVAIEKASIYEELHAANIRLKQLDKQKTEFLSIASHQLRTPLSIIKGYVELIGDGAFGKVTQKTKGVLNDIDASNERLVTLVDEFLDITRLEQGRTKYTFEVKSMNALITDVVSELRERAAQKQLSLSWTPSRVVDEVYMDEEKIRHVVFNFVDNAIKYSAKGSITVFFEKVSGQVQVRVVDQGFGFDKRDKANFFQKFYRGENVKGTNVNGTGLGIYVCKKFIEKHAGRVWADSPGLGKGSEFGFSIPLKQTGKKKTVEIDEVADADASG